MIRMNEFNSRSRGKYSKLLVGGLSVSCDELLEEDDEEDEEDDEEDDDDDDDGCLVRPSSVE